MSYEDLRSHVGHEIICIAHETPSKRVALVCKTCNITLLNFDHEKKEEKITWKPVSNKIIILRRLARDIAESIEDIHPNWRECAQCNKFVEKGLNSTQLKTVGVLRVLCDCSHD